MQLQVGWRFGPQNRGWFARFGPQNPGKDLGVACGVIGVLRRGEASL
jgi:hypothetical protein